MAQYTHFPFPTRTGTKSDLRHSPTAVSPGEADRVRRQLNANAYLECSAKQYSNINEVIHAAVRAIAHGIPVPEPDDTDACCSPTFAAWFRCC